MTTDISFVRRLEKNEITDALRRITFRGLYDEKGNKLHPYKDARFSLATVNPPIYPTSFPQIMQDLIPNPLFTAQPTIYKNQTDIMKEVDEFLKTIGKRIYNLGFEGIEYDWANKGKFHVLPPIVEKQNYPLLNGSLDIKKISKRFTGTFVKDAKGNLHDLSKRFLQEYYVDNDSKVSYLDVFNSNIELINYGLQFNGPYSFYIICDGSHRMDYALEMLNQPINVILVDSPALFPYYALPVPFRPATRLTSKEAEKMYPRLERDKIHLFNDFIKKVLHYNWEDGNLYVGSLRQPAKIN